jgi:hypothetical protein
VEVDNDEVQHDQQHDEEQMLIDLLLIAEQMIKLD